MLQNAIQNCLLSFLLWAAFTYTWGARLFLEHGDETLGPRTSLSNRLTWLGLSPASVPVYVVLMVLGRLFKTLETLPPPTKETAQ